MDSGHILLLVTEAIYNSQNSPEELVSLLEITTEDIVRKFPKKLIENAEKFGVYEQDEEEE